MDTGTIIVVAAVLLFYLRLIIIQRQHAKQLVRERAGASNSKKKGNRPAPAITPAPLGILSTNRRDWAAGVIGLVLIILGVLLRAGIGFYPYNAYWWIPVVIGLIPFSLAFR